ncbi:carbohydrate ABC transporter permease [Ornithinimicrobium cryptoxanthini]|uniref:Carbohydrate ABC transporter permease n=1 Tax=Ornithinimicrobium cryptoxanthini TaxID=2934161 RepID=A0ABY4YLP2_9MICO|nr:carbohydrate ABC transporter permease [Ornithinimicrobium cryptoxanthini]USQ77692.1 carbohydrate ABC transporter permease [Ornithinimicrobium cryptoxanthini]
MSVATGGGAAAVPEDVDLKERSTPAVRKPSVGSRVSEFLSRGMVSVVLALIAVFWLMPTIGLFVASLRTAQDNNTTGWWTALTKPAQLTVDNYQKMLNNDGMVNAFFNTVWITIPATLLVVLVASLAAYAFAWMEFPGRDWMFIVIVGLLVVPVQVALIPVANLFGDVGIYGSRISVILFHVAFGLPFAVFLLRNFFAGVPRELMEAARLDGAGEWRIFRSVVLPLGLPAIASLGIFQFLWVWNDMLVALVFADSSAAPLTVALQSQTRQFGSNIDVLATGAFLSLVVPLVVFFSFQRYFQQGVLAGSVK